MRTWKKESSWDKKHLSRSPLADYPPLSLPRMSLAEGLYHDWLGLTKTHYLVLGKTKTSSKHMATGRKKDH